MRGHQAPCSQRAPPRSLTWVNEQGAQTPHHATDIIATARHPRAMEALYFTLTAILCYLLADWLLKRMELIAGRRFENRSLVFFAIILTLALLSFALIRNFAGA